MQSSTDATRLNRWWDLPAALLLLAALIIAALRLSATNWTEHLSLMQTMTVLGYVAGLALGQSMFSRRTAFAIALVFGLFFLPWQLGITLIPDVAWSDRMTILAGRLSQTTGQLLRQKPVTDSILFMVLMSTLFWLLSVHGGYMLTRYAHPWQATLPTGMALFMIHIYDPYWPYRTWYLAAYIFFSLLLLARLTFLHRYNSWRESNTRLPPYLGLDLIRTTLLATAILVLLAWTAPALASSVPLARQTWDRVSRPWTEARSRLSNAFASLRASVGLINEYYGVTLPLGRGNQLTDQLIFTVEAPVRPIPGVRYYWRTRVYESYDGGWTSTDLDTLTLSPQRFDLNFPEFSGRWEAIFRFTSFAPVATLTTVPQPYWISRPVNVDLSYFPDGTVDLSAVHAVNFLRAGEEYEVHSSVTAVTVAELRAASTEYPQSIVERYLQLPETITPRTHQLARQITAGLDNPYDIAIAVTNFLRDNLSYNDRVPEWPSGREPIDWILFDHKQAFCNYYATAEIVLLRSLGIPARLAVGYAQGERDADLGLYQVRQRDAHAWPEVYFPEIGWVEFEPTLNQAPLERPMGEEGPTSTEEEELLAGIGDLDERNNPSTTPPRQDETLGQTGGPLNLTQEGFLVPFLTTTLAVSLLGFAFFTWRKRRNQNRIPPLPVLLDESLARIGVRSPRPLRQWAYFASLSPLERAYHEMNKALARIGATPYPYHTPAERAASLASRIPELTRPGKRLLLQYQAAVYGRHRNVDPFTAQQAARMIRKLSWRAWLNRLFTRWQVPWRMGSSKGPS